MSDLGTRSRTMVSLYSCDAAQALAMATASEKARASYRRKKVGPHSQFFFLSVCVNIFVSSLVLVLFHNQK
jgi:hypothetical protein